MAEKRTRVRAIIINNEKIISMYREKPDRIFYTFPGGGLENETEQECVIREVYEEFGINIEPIKKVYTYENNISVEHFYICKWVGGEFGTGKGEEFTKEHTKGIYKPTMINITDIPNLPLMPPEVAKQFYEDYLLNKTEVRNDVKFLNATN